MGHGDGEHWQAVRRGCPVEASPVQVGDLIKFVGVATYYRDTLGVVVELYDTCMLPGRYNSAIVYMANKDGGRPCKRGPNYHPLALEEVVKI